MLKPESLNPEEVLAHLNDLGYTNINPKKLKEFIKDLKKLIKYDQKHLNSSFIKSLACGSDSSYSESDDSYKNSNSSSSDTYKNRSSEINQKCAKSEINSERVQSSFIRPWNLLLNFSRKNKKNPDPVELYHSYKELWSKFNIPGEKNHSDLRWCIRNRMLGQEPQPRVK